MLSWCWYKLQSSCGRDLNQLLIVSQALYLMATGVTNKLYENFAIKYATTKFKYMGHHEIHKKHKCIMMHFFTFTVQFVSFNKA